MMVWVNGPVRSAASRPAWRAAKKSARKKGKPLEDRRASDAMADGYTLAERFTRSKSTAAGRLWHGSSRTSTASSSTTGPAPRAGGLLLGWAFAAWPRMCQNHGTSLLGVHYFTSRIRSRPGNEDTRRRQGTSIWKYWRPCAASACTTATTTRRRGLSAMSSNLGDHRGKEDRREHRRRIAGDAQDDVFDIVILVSGDSDVTGSVEAAMIRYPNKRVVVAFPPGRESSQSRNVSTAAFAIGRKNPKDSQFTDRVIKPDGHVLICPQGWR